MPPKGDRHERFPIWAQWQRLGCAYPGPTNWLHVSGAGPGSARPGDISAWEDAERPGHGWPGLSPVNGVFGQALLLDEPSLGGPPKPSTVPVTLKFLSSFTV